ncbi:MAG TPA: hypothetical protein PKW57_07870 [Anaerolineaceae bacterium]|jgi:hypothetical protein|nr:hypothetical protein [Anaerolineaceae bacterium]
MGTKQELIIRLFEICQERDNYYFDNKLVKKVANEVGFGNPFDATKIDNSSLLPAALLSADVYVVHLGKGIHQFVHGINLGYHKFEPINENETYEWKYRQSLLNEFDTSESNILSVASNQRIIHDFLYDDIVASPKVYNARRTKASFEYQIGNTKIQTSNLQMEIDLTLEYQGVVTTVEGKNNFPNDFAVYQLFHPYKYYSKLKQENSIEINSISCCYVLRKKLQDLSILRLFNYTFDDIDRIDSIRLLKKSQYSLVKR